MHTNCGVEVWLSLGQCQYLGKVLEIDPDADSQGNLVFPHALQYFR
jgi:hypothetical protein